MQGRRGRRTPEIPKRGQRWTAKRRPALVLRLFQGETAGVEVARPHGWTVAEDWRDKFLWGAENALRSRPRNEAALKDEAIKRRKQKVGERGLDPDLLREAAKRRPTGPGTLAP